MNHEGGAALLLHYLRAKKWTAWTQQEIRSSRGEQFRRAQGYSLTESLEKKHLAVFYLQRSTLLLRWSLEKTDTDSNNSWDTMPILSQRRQNIMHDKVTQ